MLLSFHWQEQGIDVAVDSSGRTRRVLKTGQTNNVMRNVAAAKSVKSSIGKAAGLPKPFVTMPKVRNAERMMVALWDLHCGHRFYRVSFNLYVLLEFALHLCLG